MRFALIIQCNAATVHPFVQEAQAVTRQVRETAPGMGLP